MNVPVTPEGELTLRRRHLGARPLRRDARRDGRARARSRTARSSTTPATPTTRRPCACSSGIEWRRPRDVQTSSDRQPRRDRLPHHPHAAPPGRALGRRLLGGRSPCRCTCATPTRRSASAAAGRGESYLDVERILEPRRVDRRRGDPPGLRLSRARTPTSPSAARRDGIAFVGPTPEQMRALRPEARRRARSPRESGVPLLPGSGLLDDRGRRARRGRAHRLSGDAQEHRRRRRHRHAACAATREELRRAFAPVRALARKQLRRRRRLPREATSSARATSRCRSSATARGRDRARRARLLAAAAQSEGHRGDAGAAPAARASRDAMLRDAAVRLGRAVSYRSAGTVEFVYDADRGGVLLPRGQHAPAGRARRDRGGHGRRSRRVDGARWRRASRSMPARASHAAARPRRSRCASTPRIRRADFRAERRAC